MNLRTTSAIAAETACTMRGTWLLLTWSLITLLSFISPATAAPPNANPAALIGPIDEARVAAHGIRKVETPRLVLYTDVPVTDEIKELGRVVDQAYEAWCAYFRRPQDAKQPWTIQAFLMADRAKFRQAGLLPPDTIKFLHGFAWNETVWLDDQPSAYYRRHLLLHEGTHSFMLTRLGSCGPAWLGEGLAELLATHHWADGKLTLGIMPRNRNEVPQLGRIKLVRDETAAGRRQTIEQVMGFDTERAWDNDRYAWSWALCTLLDHVPRYHDAFRNTINDVEQRDVNDLLRRRLSKEWNDLRDDWAEFTTQMEHGYDLERCKIEFADGVALPGGGKQVSVNSERGWQSTQIKLQAGRRYQLLASGQFTIANHAKPWISEANGVSIRYHAGQPLGTLLAVIRPDERAADEPSPFLSVTPVGLQATLNPTADGTLYLKLNDAASERDDNRGGVVVTVIESGE